MISFPETADPDSTQVLAGASASVNESISALDKVDASALAQV